MQRAAGKGKQGQSVVVNDLLIFEKIINDIISMYLKQLEDTAMQRHVGEGAREQSSVINTLLIIEELNNNIISLTKTISEFDDQFQRSENISQVLEELAFESNLLALSASLEELRAKEIGQKKAISLAKTIYDITIQAAEATHTVECIAGTRRQSHRNLIARPT